MADNFKVAPLSASAGAVTESPEALEYQEALNKSMQALEERMQPRTNLFNIAAGFLKPTRGGSFGESLGNANEAMGKEQERIQQEALPIAQMRAQLAGQKYEMANKEKAYGILAEETGFKTPAQAASALQSGEGMFGLSNKFTPELYMKLSRYDPKIAEYVKNAAAMDAERFKALQEATKNNMSIAQMQDQFGPDVVSKFYQLQGINNPFQQGSTMPTPPQSKTNAPAATTTKPSTISSAAGEIPVGADGVPLNAIRDSSGNVVDIGVVEEPSPQTVINGVEIKRPAQSTNAPASGKSTVLPEFGANPLGNNKFELSPSGRVVTIDPNLSPKDQRERLNAEIKVDQDLFKKKGETDIEGQAGARGKRNEPFQKKFDTLASFDYNTVQSNDIKNRELLSLMKDHPDVVGQLVHQGPIFALLQAAESGVSTPFGSLSVPVSEALNKLNLSPEKQAVARNALQLMSELNQSIMRAGKDIYGPQISAFDAQEMAKPGFKSTDPVSFITFLASKNIVTNKYLGEMASAQQKYFEDNPDASTSSFFSSRNKSYTDIVDRYGVTMRDLISKSPYKK